MADYDEICHPPSEEPVTPAAPKHQRPSKRPRTQQEPQDLRVKISEQLTAKVEKLQQKLQQQSQKYIQLCTNIRTDLGAQIAAQRTRIAQLEEEVKVAEEKGFRRGGRAYKLHLEQLGVRMPTSAPPMQHYPMHHYHMPYHSVGLPLPEPHY